MDMKQQNIVWLWMGIALMVRLYFVAYYYGWEESDYGNLAMVYGVWESGFTHFDMNHMPGYYFVSALFYGIVQNSTWAAITVSVLSGLCTLYLVGIWAKRWGTQITVGIAMLLLLIQPEFSLYASSSLREPLYTLYVLLGLQALHRGDAWKYGVWGALAFSVRFEAPLFWIPMLLLAPFGWKDRCRSAMVLFGAIGIWMLYCYQVYETPFFWQHAASVNVETGLGEEAQSLVDWMGNGLRVVWGLLTEIVPNHLGHGVLLAWLCTPFVWRDSKGMIRTWVFSVLMTGVWLGIAFVAQHEVGHNLYWKWMYPLIPLWVLCAAVTITRVLPKWGWGLLVVQALWVQGLENQRQFILSERLYGPQVRLAQWIEEHLDPSQPLLLDNVPACWLRRDRNPYTLHSWFDVPTFMEPEELLVWGRTENVEWVLFFQEEWTQAPIKAPFLVSDTARFETTIGTIHLVDQEMQYGWKWYRLSW